MKIFTTLLLLVSISLSAQNHRFVYEYTFVKDSLNKVESATENMTLDITEKGSKYYNFAVAEADSIVKADIEKQLKMAGSSSNIVLKSKASYSKATVRNVINKTYPAYSISQEDKLGMNSYLIEDDRKMVWKISPETMKIGEFNAQKATTEMYGRKWIAWFSTDLPFPDGPYKFHGLPGLIVKVEDDTKSHVMELKGVKTLPKDYAFSEKKGMFAGNTITLNYTKFKKAFVDNRENPSNSFRQMTSSISSGNTVTTTSFKMTDSNGKELDQNKMMREIEEKAKVANKKNNNLLELDLLK